MILIAVVVFFGVNLMIMFVCLPLGVLFLVVWCLLNLFAGFQHGYRA